MCSRGGPKGVQRGSHRGGLQGTRPRKQAAAGRTGLRASLPKEYNVTHRAYRGRELAEESVCVERGSGRGGEQKGTHVVVLLAGVSGVELPLGNSGVLPLVRLLAAHHGQVVLACKQTRQSTVQFRKSVRFSLVTRASERRSPARLLRSGHRPDKMNKGGEIVESDPSESLHNTTL